MKHIGEVVGLLIGGTTGVSLLAKLSNYKWYELLFMLFFIFIITICGGLAGQQIQKIIEKKWNGKKMRSRQE